jgi:hypothetical protein
VVERDVSAGRCRQRAEETTVGAWRFRIMLRTGENVLTSAFDHESVDKSDSVQVLMEWIVSSSELRVESKPRNDVAPYSFLAWNFLTIIVYLREALEILRHAWEISSPWVVHLPSLISYNNHHHPA